MANRKIERAIFRHIEAEICAYHDTLRAMENLRMDIILRGGCEDYSAIIKTNAAGTSIVERRATELADSILLREMERITNAIRGAYDRADDDCRKVVWIKYGLAIDWEPPAEIKQRMANKNRNALNVGQMAAILGIGESTFHRYRTGFVHGVAERLGWRKWI